MRAYAGLVNDEVIRERIWKLIEGEWTRTRTMLEKLRGRPVDARRPRFTRTIGLRAKALGILHRQQIGLLRRWRELHVNGRQAEADALLPEVLLSINAIASGLRTTG
jgi:phosphoenolpyruvate carboxylase